MLLPEVDHAFDWWQNRDDYHINGGFFKRLIVRTYREW
jgi:hypothetical protein